MFPLLSYRPLDIDMRNIVPSFFLSGMQDRLGKTEPKLRNQHKKAGHN
jgi:hypothetical protein